MKKKQQKQKLQTPTKHSYKQDTAELTFLEHIYELRTRLFWVVSTIILASAAGFQFKDQLIAVVMDPLHGQKLVYLTPGGGFGFIFTLAIYFGILVAIPVIVYHVYAFLRPLLKEASKKLVISFMLLSCLLAASGAAFGYFVTVPAALDFLETFAGDAVIPNLTAESYLNFVVTYILGLAVLFQLPLLLYLFDHVRPFPPGSLLSSQRYVIIGATIVAAIITPTPDAFNMAIVAVPIVLIYQLGVIAVAIRHKMVARAQRKAAKSVIKNVDTDHHRNEPMTDVLMNIEAQQSIDDAVAALATPETKAQGALQQPTGNRSYKTIDGMITRRPQPVLVPQRNGALQANVPKQMQNNRITRSLDGLSMLKY